MKNSFLECYTFFISQYHYKELREERGPCPRSLLIKAGVMRDSVVHYSKGLDIALAHALSLPSYSTHPSE